MSAKAGMRRAVGQIGAKSLRPGPQPTKGISSNVGSQKRKQDDIDDSARPDGVWQVIVPFAGGMGNAWGWSMAAPDGTPARVTRSNQRAARRYCGGTSGLTPSALAARMGQAGSAS